MEDAPVCPSWADGSGTLRRALDRSPVRPQHGGSPAWLVQDQHLRRRRGRPRERHRRRRHRREVPPRQEQHRDQHRDAQQQQGHRTEPEEQGRHAIAQGKSDTGQIWSSTTDVDVPESWTVVVGIDAAHETNATGVYASAVCYNPRGAVNAPGAYGFAARKADPLARFSAERVERLRQQAAARRRRRRATAARPAPPRYRRGRTSLRRGRRPGSREPQPTSPPWRVRASVRVRRAGR